MGLLTASKEAANDALRNPLEGIQLNLFVFTMLLDSANSDQIGTDSLLTEEYYGSQPAFVESVIDFARG